MPLPPFAHFPAAGPYGPMNPMLALATANGLYGHGGHGAGGGPHPRGGPGGRGGGNMRGGMQRGFDNGSWGEEFTKLLIHCMNMTPDPCLNYPTNIFDEACTEGFIYCD